MYQNFDLGPHFGAMVPRIQPKIQKNCFWSQRLQIFRIYCFLQQKIITKFFFELGTHFGPSRGSQSVRKVKLFAFYCRDFKLSQNAIIYHRKSCLQNILSQGSFWGSSPYGYHFRIACCSSAQSIAIDPSLHKFVEHCIILMSVPARNDLMRTS